MALKIFLGDKLVDEADAKVSVFDHGLLYGDGVFEGIRVYGGRVFLHQQHIDRLFESAKAIRLVIPMTPVNLIAAVEATAWPWVASGGVRPPGEATFPLDQASAAHLRLEAGGHVGKMVLTV